MLKKALVVSLSMLWMCFIFYNSSMNGDLSNEISHKLLDNIKTQYGKINKEYKKTIEEPDKKYIKIGENTFIISGKSNEFKSVDREKLLNKLLRKNAHAFEYLVLAILISNLLFYFNMKGKRALIYIMFICLFYAVIDEFHQSFVPERTSLVSDVLIDFSGSLIGMGLFYLFYYKLRIKFSRKSSKKHLLVK